jgi:prepilin-type N-terminal cleavage/methylation domain-containing protein
MNKNKGFTLIELLVVIAIIGILASVVLASLSTAREKGKDAAVKSQLASMKAQAELYFSKGETYTGLCTAPVSDNGFGGETGGGLLQAANASAGVSGTINVTYATAGAYNNTTCHESDGAWAVEAPMSHSTSANPHMYCTDSTGVSKIITGAALPADNMMGASVAQCPIF